MNKNKRIGVILQPGYIPWLGFFDMLNQSDVFVIYDDVQYTKRDWRSRNRIKTPHAPLWLSVPVITKGRYTQKINEAEIDNTDGWKRKHLNAIKKNYSKAGCFHEVFPIIEEVYQKQWDKLIDLDMYIIYKLSDYLGIDKSKICFSSSLNASGAKSVRLLEICKKTNVGRYITGNAAKDYIDIELFTQNEIEVIYHNYTHPIYTQLYGEFIPYLSIVDLLMNCGRSSMDIISSTRNNKGMINDA